MNTIATIGDIRAEGSLMKESSDSGFLQDDKLAAALSRAQQVMLLRIGSTDYNATRDYAGSDQPTLDKQAAYKKAESCFTLGYLPLVLTGAQLSKSGLVKTKKIGNSEVTLSDQVDAETIRVKWEHEAYLALAPYIGNKIFGDDTNPDGSLKQIGYRTKDRKLSIVGM